MDWEVKENDASTHLSGRSLSAQSWVLELGDRCWRWGWLRTSSSSRTRKQVEHPALTTQAG